MGLAPLPLAAQTVPQPLPPLDVTASPKQAAKKKPAATVAKQAAQAPAPASIPAPLAVPGTQVAPGLPASSVAQPVSTIQRDRVENTRAFSVGDLLQEVPGISIKQGNGPRDMGVSIRGSNARNGFGVRNIKVYEDGFPVTQPDGLSRTDLTDPHAYGGVDVWRGPSSALFGNYATGGAINFRTRTGREINGFEYGVDVGSFGYVNNFMALGEKTRLFEYALFASDVRSTGHLDYNAFNTQTVNLLASFTPSASDRFTFKFIHNALDTQLSSRLSLNGFYRNPYQDGCNTRAALAPATCVTSAYFLNGSGGATQPQTAAQAGLNRHDFRTIAGIRWEHKVDADTEWKVQAVLDDRNISQPTSNQSAVGDYFSGNVSAGITQRYALFGMPARHMMGVYYNDLPSNGDSYNVRFGGDATLGSLRSNVRGRTTNAGFHVREEVKPDEQWTLLLGSAIEQTHIWGVSSDLTKTPIVYASTDRTIMNNAQELGLAYKVDRQWTLRGRVATGYGTPQLGNLLVTSTGNPGDNTNLQSQTNVGYDIGFDWTPSRIFTLSTTGFYEFFQNEIVSQATGVGTTTFQFNAPRSEHRGVEVAAKLSLPSGWTATTAYLFNDQIYTEYQERLANGPFLFNRAGNKIPGNSPHELLARLGYDLPTGPLKGLGAYLEYQNKAAFYMDNGNYLQAPGYQLYNLNIHYSPDLPSGPIKAFSTFFEVRNLFDTTYVASANNIGNSQVGGVENGAAVLANTGGSIYAGMPRTFYGGMKVKF